MNTPDAAPGETVFDALTDLAARVDEVVGGFLAGDPFITATDDEVMAAVTRAGDMLRRVEGVLVEAVGAVAARSETGDVEARFTTRYGAHDVSELVQRATRVGPQTAGRWRRAAKAVRRDTSVVTGELLPAILPAMRDALIDGVIGVDGMLAVTGPLADAARRIPTEALLAADAALAATARGDGPDGSPPACADLLRVHATAWAVVLDPDGSEPRERDALHRRSLTLGTLRDGIVPLHGGLVPEVAAQLQRIIDAFCSPRVEGDTGGVRFRPLDDGETYGDHDGILDDRRATQKRHDALATALFAAASSGTLPTIGGAAPTLVVSVREEDLVEGRGWAHADGLEEPLPVSAATHTACAGVIQRILLGGNGRILRIGTEERVFNRHQRRAIALRDGGCLIPGCGIPAAWCEIHHVIEHSRGGPTHTDNGVLLCWYHHRYLDHHGWKIRIRNGTPEVQAPRWYDGQLPWRPVTTSPTRHTTLLVRRN